MGQPDIKSVAIIGAGASGAAAAAALKAEDYFDHIKVFERRECAGGTWMFDQDGGHLPLKPGALPPELDQRLEPPPSLPSTTPPSNRCRYDTTPIYEKLTTNVPDIAMCFTDCPFPYGPFVPHYIPRQYIESYFALHQIDCNLALGTTVENILKLDRQRWRLTLRKHDVIKKVDQWWQEEFDALIIANGHYSVPFVPAVKGLSEYMSKFPNRIEHAKSYRTPRSYKNQRVLVIGNSASGQDIMTQLRESGVTKGSVYVSRHSPSRWDGNEPPPGIEWKPIITEYQFDGTILFADGSSLKYIDKIIYCTGYKASYPFWDDNANGRPLYDYELDLIINNYQHTFVHDFPSLAFVGMPRVLTFRSFEYQAIAIARLWSNRAAHSLPSISEQQTWLRQRADVVKKAGRRFHQIEWAYGETMDWFRYLFEMAGLPAIEGYGRCPPVLGAQTRWAIEHVKKYPEPKGSVKNGADENDNEWEFVHAKDCLSFI